MHLAITPCCLKLGETGFCVYIEGAPAAPGFVPPKSPQRVAVYLKNEAEEISHCPFCGTAITTRLLVPDSGKESQ